MKVQKILLLMVLWDSTLIIKLHFEPVPDKAKEWQLKRPS